MPLVNFTNLDFDQIKLSIKDYLKANSNFTDYDFEGSNLSTIIDTLAYNTYITSYNANMASNEVFIDSATLRENVVALARNIGYVPRSRKAAKVVVSFNIEVSDATVISLTLKKGAVLTSASNFANNKSYVFSIIEDITIPVDSTGNAFFENITVCEGICVSNSFTVNTSNADQKFILDNSGIDTDLMNVRVRNSSTSSVTRKHFKSDGLFDVKSTTPLYFLQEISGERYELLFGDGVFGKKLENQNVVEVDYLITSGVGGNNISNFALIGAFVDNNGDPITTNLSSLTVEQGSYGGTNIESVDSVRKYAPQIYSSQNRAVTAADYEALVKQLYPETESISAFGGEELTPPQFGKVFVSIKPYNGVYVSSTIKDNIQNQIRKYSVAGILTEIIDLKYLYIETNSSVYYNSNLSQSATIVKNQVVTNINNYADSSELNKFGGRFKYSKYQKIIDDSHDSITSNITTVVMRRDLEPSIDNFAEYEICFGNRFYVKNHGHSAVSDATITGYNIKSSGFRVSGINGTVYLGDSPNAGYEDGSLFLFRLNSPLEPVIVKRSVGTIDYIKGEIKLNAIKILSTEVTRETPLIEISATPYSNDVIGLQDLYLQLDTNNVVVNSVSDKIASGNDTSGSNYIVTSSYTNGSLVRGNPILSF